MDNQFGNINQDQSDDELLKENRALKRRLALVEASLLRARRINLAQDRVETILNESLKKDLRYFQLVLEYTTNILLLLDVDGRFAYVSNSFLQETGIPSAGLINGKHYNEVLEPLVSEDSLNMIVNAIKSATVKRENVVIEEQIHFKYSDHIRTYSIHVTPMTDEEGNQTGIMARFTDITEINEALEKAKRASVAKTEFLANMSHEIRTPINAIIGMTAIGKTSDSVERKDYCFRRIEGASNHLLGVINDILDMSKIEVKKLELSSVRFCFEELVLQVVNVISFRVDEKRQKLAVKIDDAIPKTLTGDDQRLAQVITNLLSNAVKFTSEGGTIELTTQVMEEENGVETIKVEVIDNGIGISKEQQERLFTPFQQAESGTTRKYGGTGLGLVISKSIVELMGGRIWVESIPGKGSTFAFTFQAASDLDQTKREYESEGDGKTDSIGDSDRDNGGDGRYIANNNNVEKTRNRDGNRLWRIASGATATDKMASSNIVTDRMVGGVTTPDKMASSKIVTDRMASGVMATDKMAIDKMVADKRATYKPGEWKVSSETEIKACGINFEGKHILLAEDIDINREIVMAMLEPTQVVVDCAEDGEEAVRMFSETSDKYDMIFMDLQMPEMDGYEATERIRAMDKPSAKSIPIVAMTANVFREDVAQCLRVGMNGHIGKPLNYDEVIRVLRKYLQKIS